MGNSKIVGQLGAWYNVAKNKYTTETTDPNSTLNRTKTKIGEVSKKTVETVSTQAKEIAEKSNKALTSAEPEKVDLTLFLQKKSSEPLQVAAEKAQPEAQFKIDETETIDQ